MKAKTVRPLGLYLHIPFCKAKCAYCDFYSLARSEEKMDDYVSALIRHLEETAPMAQNHTVDTVYFGGGTPSYLGADRIAKLLQTVKKQYHVDKNAEITLEANPDSLPNAKELKMLRKLGVNRISLGVQSSNDEMLRSLGRVHSWQQVCDAAEAVRRAKIPHLSVDLIYGLPDQTAADWEKTLNDALSLKPDHISCYGLKLEEGTPLWQNRDKLTLPDDDAQADLYLYCVEFLQRMGYAQYEISNFALPGCESRHNLKYWQLDEYAGFGPGAHSDFGGVRYAYIRDLDRYLRGRLILSESETIDRSEREREYLMLRLRTTKGIDVREFENRFRQRFDALDELLQTYVQHGLADRTETGYRLTPKGFLVSNAIISSLCDALAEEKRRRAEKTARGDYRVV